MLNREEFQKCNQKRGRYTSKAKVLENHLCKSGSQRIKGIGFGFGIGREM